MSIAPVSPAIEAAAPSTSTSARVTEPVLRCSPVPVREPNAAVRVDHPADDPGQVQGQAPLTLVMPGSGRAPGGRSTSLTRIEASTGKGLDRTGIYPEPRAWAARFVLAALEVSQGARPADQLVRWTSPEVFATLSRRAGLAARLRAPKPAGMVSGGLRVLRVRSCEPAPAICEVALVIRDRDRIRAAALRLEGLGNRWRVTDLQIG